MFILYQTFIRSKTTIDFYHSLERKICWWPSSTNANFLTCSSNKPPSDLWYASYSALKIVVDCSVYWWILILLVKSYWAVWKENKDTTWPSKEIFEQLLLLSIAVSKRNWIQSLNFKPQLFSKAKTTNMWMKLHQDTSVKHKNKSFNEFWKDELYQCILGFGLLGYDERFSNIWNGLETNLKGFQFFRCFEYVREWAIVISK